MLVAGHLDLAATRFPANRTSAPGQLETFRGPARMVRSRGKADGNTSKDVSD
jgi:hypothetical protein